MKILFAADFAFKDALNYDEKTATECLGETARFFKNADFSIINLENVFGNKENFTPIKKTGPNLITSEDYIGYLNVLRPSVVGLSNNHTGDYGKEAIEFTLDVLKDNGYTAIGAGKNITEAYKPALLEKDNVKVAVIAVCENEFGGADEDKWGSSGYKLSLVTKSIFDAKEKGYMPIVYFHGGNEEYSFPSPGKKELYRHFVDIGAKAVVAMHTHCPQGYEKYKGAPIIYSMGNFFFPYVADFIKKSWFYGYMTELSITNDDIDIEIIPYKFSAEKHTVLSGEEKDEFMNYMEYITEPILDDKLLKKYYDAWSVIQGINIYTRGVVYKDSMVENGADEAKGLKNLLTCEAHNELITNSLKILYEERIEEAKEKIDEIKALQIMEIPK